MSGISWRIIAPVVILAVVVGAGTIFLVTTEGGRDLLYKVGFKSYQFARIDSWLDPFHDTSGILRLYRKRFDHDAAVPCL